MQERWNDVVEAFLTFLVRETFMKERKEQSRAHLIIERDEKEVSIIREEYCRGLRSAPKMRAALAPRRSTAALHVALDRSAAGGSPLRFFFFNTNI